MLRENHFSKHFADIEMLYSIPQEEPFYPQN